MIYDLLDLDSLEIYNQDKDINIYSVYEYIYYDDIEPLYKEVELWYLK